VAPTGPHGGGRLMAQLDPRVVNIKLRGEIVDRLYEFAALNDLVAPATGHPSITEAIRVLVMIGMSEGHVDQMAIYKQARENAYIEMRKLLLDFLNTARDMVVERVSYE